MFDYYMLYKYSKVSDKEVPEILSDYNSEISGETPPVIEMICWT